jgi:hypothetical protein
MVAGEPPLAVTPGPATPFCAGFVPVLNSTGDGTPDAGCEERVCFCASHCSASIGHGIEDIDSFIQPPSSAVLSDPVSIPRMSGSSQSRADRDPREEANRGLRGLQMRRHPGNRFCAHGSGQSRGSAASRSASQDEGHGPRELLRVSRKLTHYQPNSSLAVTVVTGLN